MSSSATCSSSSEACMISSASLSVPGHCAVEASASACRWSVLIWCRHSFGVMSRFLSQEAKMSMEERSTHWYRMPWGTLDAPRSDIGLPYSSYSVKEGADRPKHIDITDHTNQVTGVGCQHWYRTYILLEQDVQQFRHRCVRAYCHHV